ncbi:hypothetical protein BU15DRAFT_46001 [Melanogaster broomeanus]|nr:hypothetical protein BU15DRAFT_46001 [Melanogaster broomeanus]
MPVQYVKDSAMYRIFSIEPPASPPTVAAFKELRLTCLQTDPASFVSNYALEVAFTDDVWQAQLNSSFQRTFIASIHAASPKDAEREDDGMDAWIGTVTILGPSEVWPSPLAPFFDAGVGANWEMYLLSVMWVHPAHRGKGVGIDLVRAGLEWARTNVDPKFSDEKVEREKVMVLVACENNTGGRAFYSKAGFSDLVGVTTKDGERRIMMSVKI